MKAARRVAIMQPYLFPYIGYFQLIAAVDCFVIYDRIKYTKKGWINRNRILRDGQPTVFTLPLEAGSDHLDIRERRVAGSFVPGRLSKQIAQAYRRAPHLAETMPLVEAVLHYESSDLFDHLRYALLKTCAHLEIGTPVVTASEIEGETHLRRQARVLDICERMNASTYINPIGGTELYDPTEFARRGIELRFLRSRSFEYAQTGSPFVPWLSILDLLMFNPQPELRARLIGEYDLVEGGDAFPVLGPRYPSAAA